MKHLFILLLTGTLTYVAGCAQTSSNDRKVDSGCEDCELMFEGLPKTLSPQTSIAPTDEPGEKMVISGTIFKSDGKTPAPDVILYVYHTDNTGRYSPGKKQLDGKKHGHLRGWIKTGADGKYSFTSIRPASYPNSKAPQHIHPIIKESGVTAYWIDEYLFEDDPNLTTDERSHAQNRGGNGIIRLVKNDKGIWTGKRDIVLGKNIPGY